MKTVHIYTVPSLLMVVGVILWRIQAQLLVLAWCVIGIGAIWIIGALWKHFMPAISSSVHLKLEVAREEHKQWIERADHELRKETLQWARVEGKDVEWSANGSFSATAPRFQHTRVTEEIHAPSQTALPAPRLQVPTFRELLNAGEIGPGQKDMLFCFEMIKDEYTGHAMEISPIRGEIGEQHTQIVIAGSQSGKSVYMAGNIAQAVSLGTLLYVIDPHLKHPEKSITSKIASLQDWFIMPPAMTHDEISRVLKHATKVRDARIQGQPTPYDGYHIMVVVDEVPALMAWQRSQDKDIKQLYINLALFMQSIGTQTAKFGITGLYASQFATKDELGEVEIRDACMSQLIMKLHPVQAQAMRILGKANVNAIPKFPKGQGFLMLSDSTEVRQVATMNTTQADIDMLPRMLPPSPLVALKRPSEMTMKQAVSRGEMTSFNRETPRSLSIVKSPLETSSEMTWEAKREEVRRMLAEPFNQSQILLKLWGVRAGATEAYRTALSEYRQMVNELVQLSQGQEA